MSRDSASAMSRYGGSQSQGADSRDGYSHQSSSRSHTHSSRHTSRGYDDDSHSPPRSPGGGSDRWIEHMRERVANDDREGYESRWTDRMRERVANADRERDESRYTDSRSISGSNGGSYGGSADYSSSHGGSVSRSHSSRPGGASQLSRGPSTRGEGRGSSTRPSIIHEEGRASESRASGTASPLLRRITGGQSNGGHSSSHAGRELARRY